MLPYLHPSYCRTLVSAHVTCCVLPIARYGRYFRAGLGTKIIERTRTGHLWGLAESNDVLAQMLLRF